MPICASWLPPSLTRSGAPWDFRYLPSSRFLSRLRSLIEETFTAQGGRRVLLFGYSFGGEHQHQQQHHQAWR